MKRIIVILFVLVLILVLVACGGKSENKPIDNAETSITDQTVNQNHPETTTEITTTFRYEDFTPSEGLEFEYNEEAGGYYVSGFGSCKNSTLVIPKTHYGMDVVGIQSDAFQKLLHSPDVYNVVLPDTITFIGGGAFSYQSIRNINLPNSITYIGASAFWDCDNLTSIALPNGITQISDSTFGHCRKLKTVSIPDSVTTIGYAAFRECKNITIFCEAEKKPNGWDEEWVDEDTTICRGNEWHYVDGVPTVK